MKSLYTRTLPIAFTEEDYLELGQISKELSANRCAIARIAIKEYIRKHSAQNSVAA